MAAPKGNQFWKLRSSHGTNPIFETPEQLWDACCQYFQAIEENPLQAAELVKFQGNANIKYIPKMRAMTIDGLCNFLSICNKTWYNYANRKDFLHVTMRAERIIRDQKFTGAAAELLNPNIIARDLGLSDKKELTGKDGGPIKISDLTRDELMKIAASSDHNTSDGS